MGGDVSYAGDSPPPSRPEGFWSEASEDELLDALEEFGEELDLDDARATLRNPYLSSAVMERLLAIRPLRSHYRWRRDLARCRKTPLASGMALVPHLYWRDLARLGTDVRVNPRLRRQADQILLQRLAKLALGERIALARIASAAIVAALRKDPHVRVIRALLENPRLTEGSLMPLLVGGSAPPSTLRAIAADRRWGARYQIRQALARNPKTPLEVSLGIVSTLKKNDIRALSNDPRCPPQVRRRARVLLGESPSG